MLGREILGSKALLYWVYTDSYRVRQKGTPIIRRQHVAQQTLHRLCSRDRRYRRKKEVSSGPKGCITFAQDCLLLAMRCYELP